LIDDVTTIEGAIVTECTASAVVSDRSIDRAIVGGRAAIKVICATTNGANIGEPTEVVEKRTMTSNFDRALVDNGSRAAGSLVDQPISLWLDDDMLSRFYWIRWWYIQPSVGPQDEGLPRHDRYDGYTRQQN